MAHNLHLAALPGDLSVVEQVAKVSLLGFELGLELAATWLVLDSVESALGLAAT